MIPPRVGGGHPDQATRERRPPVPTGGVRVPSRTWFLGGIAAIALTAAFSGAMPPSAEGSGPPGGLPPTPGTPVLSWSMGNPLMGWAVSQGRLFHTQDGGHNWTLAMPPGVPRVTVAGALGTWAPATWSAVGAEDAWVVGAHHAGGRLWLYSTRTGGHQWQRLALPSPGSQGWPLFQADWLNDRDGWLVMSPGAFGGQFPIHIMATSSSGRHWETVYRSSTSGGLVTFVDPRRGFMLLERPTAGARPLFTLDRTTNGGRSWASASIPSLLNYNALAPDQGTALSVHGENGVLAGSTVGASMHPYLAVLATQDRGSHWAAGQRIAVNPQDFWTIDLEGGHTVWAVASGKLWRSEDGGRTWSLRARKAFLLHALGIDFLTGHLGFVWTTAAGGTFRVFETLDGGHHWIHWSPRFGDGDQDDSPG